MDWTFLSGILTQAALSQVNLVGGVLASRIYWQTTGGVTIGQGATFEGIILSASDVLLNTGSSMTGRIFSTKIVTLNMARTSHSPRYHALTALYLGLPLPSSTLRPSVVCDHHRHGGPSRIDRNRRWCHRDTPTRH